MKTDSLWNAFFIHFQLKKEGRRNEYEMHKLLALNQRQKMVIAVHSESYISFTQVLYSVLVFQNRSYKERQKKLPWLQKG